MIEIEARCCESSLEARRIEREHVEQLQADLNVVKQPSISSEEKLCIGKNGVLKTKIE